MSEEGKEQERSCDSCFGYDKCDKQLANQRVIENNYSCWQPKPQPKTEVNNEISENCTPEFCEVCDEYKIAFNKGKEQGYYDGETIGYKTGFVKGKEAERKEIVEIIKNGKDDYMLTHRAKELLKSIQERQ